ncbi:hypothetical protein ABFS82_12G047200 [Erythranthe guttata]
MYKRILILPIFLTQSTMWNGNLINGTRNNSYSSNNMSVEERRSLILTDPQLTVHTQRDHLDCTPHYERTIVRLSNADDPNRRPQAPRASAVGLSFTQNQWDRMLALRMILFQHFLLFLYII